MTNVNDAPVAANDAYNATEDTPLMVSAAAGTTSLTMVSDAGDYIGQGRTYNLSPATGNFSVSGSATYLTVNYQNPTNGSDYWTLQFRSPFDGVPLAAGQYLGAQRAAFRTPGNPGMDVTGQHRGSNTLTGFFTVLQIEVGPTGQVTRFSADFEQHSEGGTPALRGSVRFNYSPGVSGVLFNDTDPDGNALSALVVSNPAHGQLALNANGTFTYTPDANYNGPDSFTYVASDGQLQSNVATVSLTVTAVNDPPVGVNDAATSAEDTPASIDVLANDTDVEGTALSIGALTQPQFGTVAVQNGRVLYTPPANWHGTTSFTYRPSDLVGAGPNGNVTTVSVTVTPSPDSPVAAADSYTTDQGITLTVAAPGVLGNDSDADGDALTSSVVSGPAGGALTLNADGSFSYAPDPAFYGTDSFTYAAADGTGLSATATVTLTVLRTNDPPVAQDDAGSTNEDTLVGITVIGNDSDPNGDAIVAVVYTQPANGTAQYSANDGRIDYTPRLNWSGTDTFTYRAYDGRAYSDPATVTVTVTPVNDAPVARNDFFQTTEDTPRTVTVVEPNNPLGVLWNDTDAEGSALTAAVVTGPANGTLALNADGSFTYTPNANFNGTDTFTYTASDGLLTSSAATVTISVTAVNDAPTGNPDALTTNEDTPLAIMYGAAAGAVTANDTDVEDASNLLTIGAYTQPLNGTLEPGVTFGGLIYRPAANFTGTDTFTYRPMDRGQLLGNWTTVTITVTAVNDAPTGRPDAYTVAEDTALTVPAAGVLANDTDPEGNPFTAALVALPANGTLSFSPTGGFTYTPNPNFFGTDTFTYRPVEGSLLGAVTTVTLTVTAVNDAPVANPDSYAVAEDGTLTVPGTAPALDQQSLPVGGFYQAYNAGLSGTDWQQKVVAGRAGTLTSFDLFIDSAATVGAAFDVILRRGAPWQTSTPAYSTRLTITSGVRGQWVTFDVTAANLALAAGDSFTIGTRNGSGQTAGIAGWYAANGDNYAPGQLWYNGSITGSGSTHDLFFRTRMTAVAGVLANDTDVENNPLTAVLVSGPANGTVTLGADGGFTSTPAADFFGTDTFTYTVSDVRGGTATGTVTVTVDAVNDAPTLNALGGVTVAEDAGPQAVTLTGIGAGPGETQTLTVTASSSNPALIPTPAVGYTSPNAAGTLTFTPAANASGTATITVTVGDGALSVTRTFTITVTPVNDAPTLNALNNLTFLEDAGQQTVSLGGIGAGGGESQALTVTASSSNPALIPNPTVTYTSANSTGTIRFTPAANANGTATVTVTVSDGSATFSRQFTVAVAAVNDAPGFTAGANQSVAAGSGPRTVTGWTTNLSRGPADEAPQGLAFTVTTTNAALFVAAPSIDAAGTLTFIPEASATGTATVTVVLKDSGGTADGGVDTSVTRTFTITVTSNGLPTSAGGRMVGSELVVTGANTADTITVTPQTNNRVRVQATLNGQNYNQTFSNVTRVRVDAKGGNDTVNLSAISLPTWTDAGSGDDTVTGGSGADQVHLGDGNDTADGGGGNDLIAGGAGEDLIQGGAGDDDLYGGLGNDILVGGSAAVRSGSDSLRKVLTDWNPAASGTGGYANIRSRLLITDDGSADRLRGDAGTDWFWVGGVDLELDTPEQRN